MADVDISSVYEGVGVAEGLGYMMDMNPSINDAITVAESVTTPTFTLKLYRGTKSVTVTALDRDWDLVKTYKQFSNKGITLKGIILIPGSGAPDTFSIKDGSDSGSYLYSGAVSAATVIVYPGSECRPYIDYSECTLSSGHKITFVW